MNIIANRLWLSAINYQLRFFASKMQASSTQKTKDSAGRRLGKDCLLIEVSRSLAGRKSFLMTSSSGREV